MREQILLQREERDRLLGRSYINRDVALNLKESLDSKFIKLITGPRRAGKSTLALLMVKDKKFAYLNFDNQSLLEKWDEDLVLTLLEEVYPKFQYLLLDEAQNLPNWNMWVSKLYRNGYNLIVTGSNAKMLSNEMATALTGRFIQIELLPFSLGETIMWESIDSEMTPTQIKAIEEEYLYEGGFPEAIQARQVAKNYLNTLFDSIILKDIAKRYKIRNIHDLYDVAEYLLSNFCNLFTYSQLTETLGQRSVNTTKKFCDYLHEPYLFFYLPRYNNKLQLMKKAPQKVYVVDNGFVQSSAFNLSENLGRLLENQVFIELLRRGYDTERTIFYYRTANDKEVDFVLRTGHQVESLVQVCYDISNPKTLKREINALAEASKELRCENLYLITNSHDEILQESDRTIQIQSIATFNHLSEKFPF